MIDIDPVEKQHAIEVLDKALEIFGPNGEHWTKREFARNKNGRRTSEFSETAVCFCSAGAVYRSMFNLRYNSVSSVIFTLMTIECGDILTFNDAPTTTFSDVKRVFLNTRVKLAGSLS